MIIQDDDILLLNQGGTDYKITAKRYKESINDPTLKIEGLMLVNRSGVDYKTTVADLTEYINTPPPMPWDDYDVVLHIKNPTKEMTGYLWMVRPTAWDIDGTNERKIESIQAGEELVFGIGKDELNDMFIRMQGSWDFGELTDTSKVEIFTQMFMFTSEFNGDVSNIDTSNATDMEQMFFACTAFNNESLKNWNTSKVRNMWGMFSVCDVFNQDLSQWCVSSVTNYDTFDEDAFLWEDKHKPVWGTCPRGEDQS